MKSIALALLLVFPLSVNASYDTYHEVANLSKNWSTSQLNPFLFQYFTANGTRINMSQDCTGTAGSQEQCWKAGAVSDSTSVSPYLTIASYNISVQTGAPVGQSFPNVAITYYITSAGNYTINGSYYSRLGGDVNFTIKLNGSSVICSGFFTVTGSRSNYNCSVGNDLPIGAFIELDIGSGGGGTSDWGNMTAVVYGVLGSPDVGPLAPVIPAAGGIGTLNYSIFDDSTFNNGIYQFTTNATQLGKYSTGTYSGAAFNDLGSGSCSIAKTATYGRVTSSSNGNSCTAVWISNSYGTITVKGGLAAEGATTAILQHWMPNGTVTTIFQTANTTANAFDNLTYVFPGSIFRIYSTAVGATTGFHAHNVSYNGSPNYGYVFIEAKDEVTGAAKTFNVTFSNGTNTTNYQSTLLNFYRNYSDVPSGNVTVTVSNDSCQTGNIIPRSQVMPLTGGTASELNKTFYLLCDGATVVFQQFIVVNQFTSPVSGASVVVTKQINSVNTTIGSLTTDSLGSASIYLNALDTYYVTVTKTGYTSTTITIAASGSQITIPITQNVAPGGYDGINLYFNWTMLPEGALGYPLFSVNVSVNGTVLSYYGLNLTFANGTQIFYANYTNASGSLISSGAFNRTYTTGTLYATLFVGKDGYTQFTYTRTFVLTNYTNGNSSLTTLVNNLVASDASPSFKAVLALFGSLMFTVGAGAAGFGTAGIGIMFIASLAFFGLVMGFVEANIIYLLIFVAIAVYSMNKGW